MNQRLIGQSRRWNQLAEKKKQKNYPESRIHRSKILMATVTMNQAGLQLLQCFVMSSLLHGTMIQVLGRLLE